MSTRRFVIGTRGSALALAQARHFAAELKRTTPGILLEEKIIKTRGDQRMDVRLADTGPLDKGLFTRELETALHDGVIDCAVHSLKDLPVEMPDGFALGAILARENPADVLINKPARKLEVVATSSPRRALQLRVAHPGVQIKEIRGNVPTRIRKLREDKSLDGLVLALAGLKRLGLCDESGRWLQQELEMLNLNILDSMLPAPGQGAVGIQIRSEDAEITSLLQAVHCQETSLCVNTERALLTALGGGCHMALGARADVLRNETELLLRLRAVYFPDEEPASALHGQAEGSTTDARKLVARLKNQLISK